MPNEPTLTIERTQMALNDHLKARVVVEVGVESRAEQANVLRLEGELRSLSAEELAAGWDPDEWGAGYGVGAAHLDLAQLGGAKIDSLEDGCGLVAWLSDDAFLTIRWVREERAE